MLKHCSTLSLDTSRRSLRMESRLSLAWAPNTLEEGEEVRWGGREGSMATLPRPRERMVCSLVEGVGLDSLHHNNWSAREESQLESDNFISKDVVSLKDLQSREDITSVTKEECPPYSTVTRVKSPPTSSVTRVELPFSTSASRVEGQFSTSVTKVEGPYLSSMKKTEGPSPLPEKRAEGPFLSTVPVSGRLQSSVRAIKVYAQCLRPHLSYKTVVITPHTTSKQVILGLLSRFRMKHRDPNLFHLTMEVRVDRASEEAQTILLEDNARPADMISCNPWAGCKFILQAKQGGLVKVYDSMVRPDSVYKCLIISEETTVGDTISILRSCYRDGEEEGELHLEEVGGGEERRLKEGERPLILMAGWGEEKERRFLLRRGGGSFEREMARGSVLRRTVRRRRGNTEEVLVDALSRLSTEDSEYQTTDTASEAGSEEASSDSSGRSLEQEAMSTSSLHSSSSSTTPSDSSDWIAPDGYCSIYITGGGANSFFT